MLLAPQPAAFQDSFVSQGTGTSFGIWLQEGLCVRRRAPFFFFWSLFHFIFLLFLLVFCSVSHLEREVLVQTSPLLPALCRSKSLFSDD